jgi:hypothetical protein
MEARRTPMNPDEVAQRYAEMLGEAGLPRFASASHDPAINELQLAWDHGLTLHFDLTQEVGPIDEASLPGVVVHRVPPLHPDDVTTLHGIPVTSPSRTLIDCAEFMTASELRAAFARAQETGLLDPDALRASRARVEWRPSLAMLDEVIAEFCD